MVKTIHKIDNLFIQKGVCESRVVHKAAVGKGFDKSQQIEFFFFCKPHTTLINIFHQGIDGGRIL